MLVSPVFIRVCEFFLGYNFFVFKGQKLALDTFLDTFFCQFLIRAKPFLWYNNATIRIKER